MGDTGNPLSKKIALFLVIVGVITPVITFPFASGYNPTRGFLWSISRMEIMLYEIKTPIRPSPPPEPVESGLWEDFRQHAEQEAQTVMVDKKVILPYKFVFAGGLTISMVGLAIYIFRKT